MANLLIAGLFEIGWALGMKFNQGFTKMWPTVATLVCMGGSLGFLSMALKNMPIGTAYAIWTGIGAAGTALVGMMVFSEPHTITRLFCISLIIGGVVGLQLATSNSKGLGTSTLTCSDDAQSWTSSKQLALWPFAIVDRHSLSRPHFSRWRCRIRSHDRAAANKAQLGGDSFTPSMEKLYDRSI